SQDRLKCEAPARMATDRGEAVCSTPLFKKVEQQCPYTTSRLMVAIALTGSPAIRRAATRLSGCGVTQDPTMVTPSEPSQQGWGCLSMRLGLSTLVCCKPFYWASGCSHEAYAELFQRLGRSRPAPPR